MDFWIALLIGGVSFFEPAPRSQSRNRKSSALEIPAKRYANGDQVFRCEMFRTLGNDKIVELGYHRK